MPFGGQISHLASAKNSRRIRCKAAKRWHPIPTGPEEGRRLPLHCYLLPPFPAASAHAVKKARDPSQAKEGGEMAGRPATGGFSGGDAMIKVDKDSDEFVNIQHRFYTNMGSTVPHCPLVELHRILNSTPTGRARLEAFNRQVDAMKQKHGGNPNERFAFYEASKRNVQRIINDGFDVSAAPDDGGYFGIALYLSPEPCAINSVMSATVDENGLRHVLLCRVILGGAEEVVRGSGQSRPSSGNFDSAVDNHRSPTRYIIWYPDVQSRVLPLYVLSVEVDFRNRVLHQALVSRPTSPWMPIGDLLSALSARLPRSTMCRLRRLHNDKMEKKITREQMVRSIREITGDQMLLDAMRTILGRKQ